VRREARDLEDHGRTFGVGIDVVRLREHILGYLQCDQYFPFSLSKYTHIRVRPVPRVRADADPRRRAGQARKVQERVCYEQVRQSDDRQSSGLWIDEVEQR
jgi:hypothetical protein